MQGCPASAFLFNNAIGTFLASFDKALRSRNAGIVRACADDIGIVLKQLKHLKIIYPIFNDCKSHAGLALKPPKGVLVPLRVFHKRFMQMFADGLHITYQNGNFLMSNHLLSCLVSLLGHRLAQ